MQFDVENEKKILGLVWDTDKDILKPSLTKMLESLSEQKVTKRQILSFASLMYDPFGFLAPFVLVVKLFIQRLWLEKYTWDAPLPECLLIEWRAWTKGLRTVNQLEVKRHFGQFLLDKNVQVTIHAFSDASPVAYGAVLYFQIRDFKGDTTVQLLLAKSRVAPLQKITVPRLELMGALVAARLTATVKRALNLEGVETVMWTDSMIVIHWLRRSTKRWEQFVANRVAQILSLTDLNMWRHCPGDQNPADLLSRGTTAEQLLQSSILVERTKLSLH